MNMRRVVFVVALALVLGGGALYKSPISFAAETTSSTQSSLVTPFRTQAASVYTALQDFWNNLFGTSDLAKSPTEIVPQAVTSTTPLASPPLFGGSASKSAQTPSLGNPTSKLPPTTITRTIVLRPSRESADSTTERVLSGVTATDVAAQIAALRADLLAELAKSQTTTQAKAVADNNALYLAMAPMNRINNLSSVTISSPTITGANLTGSTISGYLPTTGGSLSGDLSGTTGTFSSTLNAATLGVGTTSPSDTFAVNGVTYLADVSAPAVTTNRLYSNSGNLYWAGSVIGGSVGSWTLSGSDVYRATGNVGIGTTSPFTTLSVTGNAYLSGALNVGATSTTRVNLGLDYATSTDITNRTNIATWGDSLTGDNVSILTNTNRYPLVLSRLTGYTVSNGGVSGETSTSIKTRMLAATDKYSYPTIIWAGRNNYSSPTTVKADIAAMVAALTTDRYIILGVVNSDTASEWSGGGNYTIITQLNTDLATIYGTHFIDIRAYLISNGLTDAGITATAQDLIDIGHDVPPSSLRVDSLHYNSAGYASVAKRISQSISLLQRTTATALTPESLLTVNLNGFKSAGVTVLYASTTSYSTLTGLWAGAALNGSGLYNTATGYLALSTATSSSYNTAFGYGSLQNTLAGSRNTAIGYFSGQLNTYGTDNTATGYYAGYGNSTGTDNTAIGGNAMQTNSTGSQNTATGRYALYQSSSANGNTANGYTALFNNTGSQNTAIGLGALYANGAAGDNTSVGYQSLYANTTGSQNTALGFRAGWGDGTVNMRSSVDTYGTFLGYEASRDPSIPTATILTNITAIGKNARVGASNSIALGGMYADSVKVGIGTSTPYAKLSVHANNGETSTTLFAIASSTASATTTLFSVLNTGNVGIGTAAPLKALQVVGDIRVGTSGTNGCIENFAGTALTGVCSSDETLKTNIQPMGSVLADLTQLTPSTFYWNDIAGNELHNSTTTMNYGLIAQDVAKVLPGMVATTTNGYLGVNYSMLPILTLQGLKELDLNLEGLASTTAATIDTTGGKTFVGRFFDRMTGWLADVSNGIGEFFANRVHTKTLCVGDKSTGETCITKDQLDTLLSGKNTSSGTPAIVNTATTTAPIIISINGNNPATINVGETYGDLGALITAPESAKNFGIKASLDGGPEGDISQISIDTSVAGSHTIVYSVVDQNNATTTAERVVNVVAPVTATSSDTATTTVAE